MIPAVFAYSRARTLDEALELIAGADPSIRVLAGGQSLIPLMKLRLARPERLVDLGRLPELRGIRDRAGGGLAIGALTTWAELLADPRIRAYGALGDAIPIIGDVQVRNLGTIGGSLAHADPASDIAGPALALEIEVVARSAARGERSIAARDFFMGPFATSLESPARFGLPDRRRRRSPLGTVRDRRHRGGGAALSSDRRRGHDRRRYATRGCHPGHRRWPAGRLGHPRRPGIPRRHGRRHGRSRLRGCRRSSRLSRRVSGSRLAKRSEGRHRPFV